MDDKPPKRKLSAGTWINLLFGGLLNWTGWTLLIGGLILNALLMPNTDMTFIRADRETVEVKGFVLDVNVSHYMGNKRNKKAVYATKWYTVLETGKRLEGTSYVKEEQLRRGDGVQIVLPVGHDEAAKIRGSLARPLPPSWLGLLLIPLSGGTLALVRLGHSCRKASLLSRGALAHGSLVSKTRTNVEVNESPVYSLTYRYSTRSGEAFELTVRTSDSARYEGEHAVIIAYDHRRPSRGVFLHALPGMTRIEADRVRTEVDSSTMAFACFFGMLLFGLIASCLYATLMFQARPFW
ncbi:DUF3592 domain-containing protein [Paenibacillus methanolicus]|uniref:DUF3592 domain-containing protein n=1 Tax=Paenibacillus methanolicus TaxID=582686 RepID=A0A5S5BTY0_9BACL|nr:DUF3592 domain-containing protein [Paenibacillus methanolicus]TYP69798.1 hypothetical protein BCM02_113130 [Paenibacillus methanolicus]